MDGAVTCNKCGTVIVDFKCPYGSNNLPWHNKTLQECASSKLFCCSVFKNDGSKLKLKDNHSYMCGISHQLCQIMVQYISENRAWTTCK